MYKQVYSMLITNAINAKNIWIKHNKYGVLAKLCYFTHNIFTQHLQNDEICIALFSRGFWL